MKINRLSKKNATISVSLASMAVGLLTAIGCTNESDVPMPAKPAVIAGQPGQGQALFDSDTAAVNALQNAVTSADREQIHHLLGPAWTELVSGDKVEDADDFKDFAQRFSEKHRIQKVDDTTSLLRVGSDDWMFPIPIARDSKGMWFFDTESGKEEVLARRVGQNELDAIQTCRDYVKAQREYANATGSGAYAQRFLSTPGKHDGLYWRADRGQPQSPLARFVAEEKSEGYKPKSGKHEPYRGYRFHILKSQGPNAPGGALDYIVNGKMTRGFALVAYPVAYGSSGVMTFVVNQDGKVYQKDLGPDTTKLARSMQAYNPDNSWTVVPEENQSLSPSASKQS